MASGQDSFPVVVAARVRRARVEAGLSQQDLADKIGCSLRAVQTWEQDSDTAVQRPHGRHLRALAEATGRDTRWFFEEEVAA